MGHSEAHNIEGYVVVIFSCYCAFAYSDHMIDMLKHNISNSKAIDDVKNPSPQVHEHYSNLYVLILNELTDDIGSTKYSLLLDEGKHISII